VLHDLIVDPDVRQRPAYMLNLALIAHCPQTGNIGGLAYADRRAIGSRLLRVHHGDGHARLSGGR